MQALPALQRGAPVRREHGCVGNGFADASDPVLQAPENAADAATEEQKPKQSASVLDELCHAACGRLPPDIASGALSLPPNNFEACRQSGLERDDFRSGDAACGRLPPDIASGALSLPPNNFVRRRRRRRRGGGEEEEVEEEEVAAIRCPPQDIFLLCIIDTYTYAYSYTYASPELIQ